jgi:serine-type D-Ala-D-Ala carboxypeptidase/endopeptidase (penicillin-binding protein 4)
MNWSNPFCKWLAQALVACAAAIGTWPATAQPAAAGLPQSVEAVLARQRVPLEHFTLLVQPVDGSAPRAAHRHTVPVNPASVMKLVTTFAALDTLGPAFTWQTGVWLDGTVDPAGTLRGDLILRGSGDPKLVVERLTTLLQRVQALGIRQIAGDIVLDRSAFEAVPADPAAFDGEPLRPYNATPDALLVNFKAMVFTLVPDHAANVARVALDLPLAGVQWPASVALSPAECGDWRSQLRADFSDPTQVRFAGSYPAACGERVWPVAYPDPGRHAARAVAGVWAALGGSLTGSVREGRVSNRARLVFEFPSLPLADVVRDVNKFSNNVMAQQLFLSLSAPRGASPTSSAPAPPASLAASRDMVRRWWVERVGHPQPPVVDNGSGLSRQERISAEALSALLQAAWLSPVMPDLMASLPLSGVDGTLRRQRLRMGPVGQSGVGVSAHLKTGSLRDVAGVAGYVLGRSGQRYIVVAIANTPNPGAARPAIDAAIEWAIKD